MRDLALYIHFPFCKKRCNYCDFNTFAGKEALTGEYCNALCQEIRMYADQASRYKAISIYLGGGTPSIVPIEQLNLVLRAVEECYPMVVDPEVTLEANPGTVNRDRFERYREMGINRISLGCQSFLDGELKLLGRIHTVEQNLIAFHAARQAGFRNINLDLIFGLPGQTLEDFRKTLLTVIALMPDHLSLYALTLEEHTPLFEMIRVGQVQQPDDDLVASMYELATEILEQNGFVQYEISNWARKSDGIDLRSRHNLQYWCERPYLGFGAGAHSFLKGYRFENAALIEQYIAKIHLMKRSDFPKMAPVISVSKIGKREQMQETMMLGLRLTEEGVGSSEFHRRFGLAMDQVFSREICKLSEAGLLEWVILKKDKRLRLTKRGRLLGNRVFREFVGKN